MRFKLLLSVALGARLLKKMGLILGDSLEPSKVSKISESTSPAKIPHRSDVDHLDEEVLYVDVQ